MSIEVVFFDAGETLLHPDPSWSDLSAQILCERGHEVGVDQLRAAWAHTGRHFQEAAERGEMFSHTPDASRRFWHALYTDLVAHLGISDEGAPQVLYEVFSDPARYVLFDDTIPTLDALADAGYRLGVISNFEGWLDGLLRDRGIHDRFEVIAISGPLEVEKPDPEIFAWATGRAGVNASVCAHIGDSPFFDAQAACDAGLYGILLDRHGRQADQDLPYPRVSSLNELHGVLAEAGPMV